jgi:DNA invertase Pin-like site-specific DNA recombinase
MALRTVVYCRKSSSDKDEKQIHSITRQQEDIREYFEKNMRAETDESKRLVCDFKFGKDFFYEDESAKIAGRKQFNKMIEILKKNKFDVLLCTELSRLSRNPIDNGAVVDLLDEKGKAKITHLKEVRTMDKTFKVTPTDKFTLSLFLSVAKYENDQRAKNTQSGIKSRKKAGATTNLAPLGYLNAGTEKGKKWVEKDGDNFDKARELWDLLLSGSYILKDIYKEARAMGLTNYKGKGKRGKAGDSTMREMFNSRYYTGKIKVIEDGKEVWKDGNHPEMVSKPEFEQAQLILQKLGYKHAKIDKAPDIGKIIQEIALSGIYTKKTDDGEEHASIVSEVKTRYTCIRCKHRYYSKEPKECPECSTAITPDTKITSHRRFYHYTQDKDKKDSITLKVIVGLLERELENIYISDKLFTVLRKQLYTLWLKKNEFYKQRKNGLRHDIDKLEKKLEDLITTIHTEEGESDKTVQEERELVKKRLQERIVDKNEELEDIGSEYEDTFERAWHSLQVLRDAKMILAPETPFEPKKQLVLSLISNLIFHKDSIEVVWHKPFNLLAKSKIAQNKRGDKNTNSSGSISNGSRGRTRTDDQLVNSQLLYH